jgi:hypothetical protein
LSHSSRNATNARVNGISRATQKRYNTWQEAYGAYMIAYKEGTVCATPIVNSPFDPFAGGDEAELAAAFTHLVF